MIICYYSFLNRYDFDKKIIKFMLVLKVIGFICIIDTFTRYMQYKKLIFFYI